MNKTKKGKLKKLPGIILGLIALIAAAVFSATVISTQMLSTLYIGLVIAACAVATIIALCLLVTDPRRHKVRFSFGVIWLVLCIAVYSVAGVLISNTQNTLRQIADSSGESVNVSFYVKAEDPATTLEEARDYTFGILASLDRENTDAALSAVEEQQGFTLQIREYNGLTQLADALLDGQVGGIEVYSDTAFDSRGAHFDQGINHLNGEEALIYCRERYAYADGDRHRGQNQMDVIKAIAEKAVSPSILKNYLSVLDSLQDYMETSVPYDLIGLGAVMVLPNKKMELTCYEA